MHFSVRHRTCYRYSDPVHLGLHRLRLTPRGGAGRLLLHELAVDPAPVARRDGVDAYGNRVTELDFAGAAGQLIIDSRFEFVTPPGPAPALPVLPPLPWAPLPGMTPYLGTPVEAEVAGFARRLQAESGTDPAALLTRLNRALFERTDRRIRPEGAAHSARITLDTGSGACRDLTVLFMDACRSLGLPARFVSGYQAHAETPDGKRHLHAWPEVFLPGAGWRGYDPTHGQPVAGGHVALCAAPDQAGTMPVEGGFWGDGVTSTLDYALEIEVEG